MSRRLSRLAPAIIGAALALSAVFASAQRPGRSYNEVPFCFQPDECPRTPYDGRFTFVRVYFDTRSTSLGGWRRRGGGGEPPWHHDRPEAERNLSAIMREVTYARTFDGPTGGNVFALDDPEMFRYPVLWVSEPGFWVPSDEDVENLRAYLLKGGFIIFDDFDRRDFENLVVQMSRVLPDLQPIRLTGEESIFQSFFDIDPGSLMLPGDGGEPQYWGLFEGNDKDRRQLVMMNVNNDIGELMEYSATGFYPVDMTNDAYKLGVNYMIYAMTH